jgi:ribose 5-phosphate isomerase A
MPYGLPHRWAGAAAGHDPGGPVTIFERALSFVPDGARLGLGSGRTLARFTEALAARVRGGVAVRVVPTSAATAEAASRLGIPLASLEDSLPLDLGIDGADECDPNLDLIKGYGRALVREKVVAAAARRLVVLIGPGKQVPVLGSRGRLPVEVVPFARPLCERRLAALGLRPVLDVRDGRPFVSDNGNHILDCGTGPIDDPVGLERELRAVPGVVGTGLFLGVAQTVLVGDGNWNLVKELTRP